MKKPLVLAALLLLTACSGDAGSHADAQATRAPTTVFRDALLAAAVKAQLAGEDIDSTTRIGVGVRDGAVVLSGKVASDAERARAVASAQKVTGVQIVTDRLAVGNVGPGAAKRTADLAVAAGVEGALAAQTGVNVSRIHVSASDGTVTLAGIAPTAALRATMLAAAKSAPGVRAVIDRIAVKP